MKYLFGIITDGKRLPHLLRQIDSIKALNVPDYEIVVAGNTTILPPEVRPIPMHGHAERGQLGAMRNALCRSSDADIFIITDDDMLFHPGFIEELEKVEDWEVLCTRMLNPDGTRNWDWCTKGGPRGHCLIEYWETDPFIYVSGGRMVMKAEVFDKVQWDEARGFYQEEDIDFSKKLKEAGISIKMNKKMTITHDDPRYTSVGHSVYRTR